MTCGVSICPHSHDVWKLCTELISDLSSSHSPSEHVRIIRELCDITVTTGKDAVFEVELSHSGVTNGEWWLSDNLLQNNDLNQMSVIGRVHRLVLKMVTTDESGDVAFVVGEKKSVACLLVEEKPKGKGDEMVIREFSPSEPSSSKPTNYYYSFSNPLAFYIFCIFIKYIL